MASEKEFQEKMLRLGTLVGELDQVPGGGSKVQTRELVQLLMEVHGTGLERLMELVSELDREPGKPITNRIGQDPVVRNLLLLYGLHPDDLETRILRAIDTVRGRLRKFDMEVKLVSIHEGAVEVQLHRSGHARGSNIQDVRSIVEGGIYDLAPDLTSLNILGLEEESASGFVPLESLLKQSFPAHALVEVDGGD